MGQKDELKKHAKQALSVGVGIAQIIGEQVKGVVKNLESEGYFNRAEGERMVKEALREANSFQEKLSARLDKKVRGIVNSSGATSRPKQKARRSTKK